MVRLKMIRLGGDGLAHTIDDADISFRNVVGGIEERKHQVIFGHRRQRHGVVVMADGLLRRSGMRVDVVEIGSGLPARETGAEEIAGVADLSGSGSEANASGAPELLAVRELIEFDERGVKRRNIDAAVAIEFDFIALGIVEEHLVRGLIGGIAIAIDAGETGCGEDELRFDAEIRVAENERSGDIEPASVESDFGTKIRHSGKFRQRMRGCGLRGSE